MSDRTIPFEENSACESCGAKGAYDFMGDILCGNCAFPESSALARTDQLAKSGDHDLIKAVAMDIGKQVAHHIEIMYPDAVAAASSTFLLSVRGCVCNEIMAAIDSDIDVAKRLAFNDKFRQYIRAQYRKIRSTMGKQEVSG